MLNRPRPLQKTLAACLFSSLLLPLNACSKKDDAKDTTEESTAANTHSEQGKAFVTTGQLALGTFGLTTATNVTHVIAFNADSGKTKIAEVDAETGKFEIALTTKVKAASEYSKADGSLDREAIAADGFASVEEMQSYTDEQIREAITREAEESPSESSPWILTYVNGAAKGSDMVISRFGSETLDTLAPSADSTKTLDLGTVTPVAGSRATSDTSYASVLEATGLSTGAAATLGAIDAVSLRNSNPDIDNSGTFDAVERKTFTLDFHNRFSWTVAGNTAQIDHSQFKNKFPEDVVGGLTQLGVVYGGTGIVPELEKSEFTSAPTSYKWKFNFADPASAAVVLNNGDTCTAEGGGTSVANDSWCTQTYTADPSYSRYQLGLEVMTPPEGTYTLEAAGKTYTWTNVEVSDFSAGEGFLALMVSWTVNENGTADSADDRLTGFKFKYMKKDATAGWVAATQEELDLIIKSDSARVGFKVANTSMSCGWRAPKQPSGEIVFAQTDIDEACDSNPVAAQVSDLKGTGLLWSSFYNAGVSYDDKLGMRFFF